MASGVVRRLDNLGRIVIPKEIRKDLKLKGNEKVAISVIDDSIVLNRYSDIHEYDQSIKNLINSIKKVFNKDIIITNLNNITLTTSLYESYLGLELSFYLNKVLEERKDVCENIPSSLSLNDNRENLKVAYIIKPIIVNGDLTGLLILLTDNNLESNDLKLLEFINLYLENYLE